MPRAARLPILIAALCAAALAAGCRREEPALTEPADVIARLVERMREDYAGVQDFTVVSDSALVYFERTAPLDSLPAFRTRATSNDGAQQPLPDPYHLPAPGALAQLRTTGRLAGQDTLGGRRVYVVEAEDARAFLLLNPATPDSGYAVRVFVDAETFRVAGVRVEQPPPAAAPNPAAGPLVQILRYDDYRDAGGVTLPFRSRLRLEGLRALTPDDERMVMGGNLALQRAQAERLPAAERTPRLREIDRMARFYTEGVLTGTFTVREVRVNAGSPWGDAPPPPAAPAPTAPLP